MMMFFAIGQGLPGLPSFNFAGTFVYNFALYTGADGGGGGVQGVRTPPPPLFDQAFLCKFLMLYIL